MAPRRHADDAEGATAPETLRHQDRWRNETLESKHRDAQVAGPAVGVSPKM